MMFIITYIYRMHFKLKNNESSSSASAKIYIEEINSISESSRKRHKKKQYKKIM